MGSGCAADRMNFAENMFAGTTMGGASSRGLDLATEVILVRLQAGAAPPQIVDEVPQPDAGFGRARPRGGAPRLVRLDRRVEAQVPDATLERNESRGKKNARCRCGGESEWTSTR